MKSPNTLALLYAKILWASHQEVSFDGVTIGLTQEQCFSLYQALRSLGQVIAKDEAEHFNYIRCCGLPAEFKVAFLSAFPEFLKGLMGVLLENKHLLLLMGIAEGYRNLVCEHWNIKEIMIEHSEHFVPHEPFVKEVMARHIQGSLLFNFVENPDLIAGFVARLKNQSWDYSLVTQVHLLRERLKK